MSEFEWDPVKGASNVVKHGVSFSQATLIFDRPTLTRIDDRQDYGEARAISIGSDGQAAILVVVHTPRGQCIRIISALPASSIERRIYESSVSAGDDVG